MNVEFVQLPVPKMGSKIWLLERAGIFCLERGPGVIRTDACTHAGAGSVTILDGVPRADGHFDERASFPGNDLEDFVNEIRKGDPSISEEDAVERVRTSAYNGRPIYLANPAVMGSWMLDGGFYHGLTLIALGGHQEQVPFASIVWMPRIRAGSAPKAPKS